MDGLNTTHGLALAGAKTSATQQLANEHATVMHSLALAMKAARCWADIRDVSEAIRHVEYMHFRPMFKEVCNQESDRAGGMVSSPAQEQLARAAKEAAQRLYDARKDAEQSACLREADRATREFNGHGGSPRAG